MTAATNHHENESGDPERRADMSAAGYSSIPTRWTLIQRLKDREDRESWGSFFDTYWRLIYNVGRRAGLSHPDAEEVVQETVISVCRNIETFRADPSFGTFKSWLLCLTRWRITDQFRKQQRRREADCATSVREAVPDESEHQLENIWQDEWREHLLTGALESLKRQVNPRHYQLFYLHVIKKVPVREAGKTLNVSAGQIYLAKHRLAPLFKKAWDDLEKQSQSGPGGGAI